MSRPRDQLERAAAGARDLERAGQRDAQIEIVEYDPRWPDRFAAELERLQPIIGGAEIHHVGSTAVPGLAAKPIIDIMALVEDLDAPIPELVERGGYEFPEAYNATLDNRRWLCRPSASIRTHHLHLTNNRAELQRHLTFRDRLRDDARLVAEYAQLKRDQAHRFRNDREAYTAAKTSFVRRVENAHSP